MQHIETLYGADGCRELDRRAIEDHGVRGYTLMQRAAAAAWRALTERWPAARRLVVIAGRGNNGGDGYELAQLARRAGLDVDVYAVGGVPEHGDAALAHDGWKQAGGSVEPAAGAVHGITADVIVDALYGTGLSRAPRDLAEMVIGAVNAARARGCGVLAVDLPSGLLTDTGATPGVAVGADLTVTFIGNKLGLYTGRGPDLAGRVVFDDLEVPDAVYRDLPVLARLQTPADLERALPRRSRTAHKGGSGHVLLVGGAPGTAGAMLLAARGALRAGAGLVSVATWPGHAVQLTAAQPEAMIHGVETPHDLEPLLSRADVVAVGPGLGQTHWARALWRALLDFPRLVLDADALNLLAQSPHSRSGWVLTPHPGEAARLLETTVAAVQADRPAALRALAARYGGYPLLKGAGTLVWQGSEAPFRLCPFGNPGMAVGGMGDVLTGITAALLAQGLAPADVAATAVLLHARAGDRAAADGERGMLPSDLLVHLRPAANPCG